MRSMSNDEVRQWLETNPDPELIRREVARCYERIGMNLTSDTSLNYYRERLQILRKTEQ